MAISEFQSPEFHFKEYGWKKVLRSLLILRNVMNDLIISQQKWKAITNDWYPTFPHLDFKWKNIVFGEESNAKERGIRKLKAPDLWPRPVYRDKNQRKTSSSNWAICLWSFLFADIPISFPKHFLLSYPSFTTAMGFAYSNRPLNQISSGIHLKGPLRKAKRNRPIS